MDYGNFMSKEQLEELDPSFGVILGTKDQAS